MQWKKNKRTCSNTRVATQHRICDCLPVCVQENSARLVRQIVDSGFVCGSFSVAPTQREACSGREEPISYAGRHETRPFQCERSHHKAELITAPQCYGGLFLYLTNHNNRFPGITEAETGSNLSQSRYSGRGSTTQTPAFKRTSISPLIFQHTYGSDGPSAGKNAGVFLKKKETKKRHEGMRFQKCSITRVYTNTNTCSSGKVPISFFFFKEKPLLV